LLVNPDPQPIADMLLVPELEQTRRGGRLDSTDRIQIVDIGGSQPLAVDLTKASAIVMRP
jgi:hypothetical protein